MSEINYEEITDPMMLDSTGQGIITALTQIKNTVQPTNACIDIDISIAANVWPNSAPYEYTYLDSKITSGCSVKVDFLEGAQSAEVLYMRYSKVVGGVKFTAPVKPTTAIPVRLHLTGLDAESVTAITGSMVSTSSVPSKANVEEALTDHESRIGTLSNQIGNLFSLFSYSFDAVTVPANGVATASAKNALDKPAGYSTVGIRSVATGSVNITYRGFDGANGYIYLVNNTSGAVTTTPSMEVIVGLWST